MDKEEFNLDEELMDVRVRRIKEERQRRQELEETLKKYKLKRIRQEGIAIGIAGAILAIGMGAAIGRRNMGVEPLPTVITEEDGRVKLTRTYTIQFGDTLSGLSNKTGIPISTIQKDNNISNPNEIYMNQKLVLNYSVNPDDLDYYTQTVTIDGKSLDSLASEYNTTVSTLLELNDGKIDKEANTIIVPNFITPPELTEAKESRHK